MYHQLYRTEKLDRCITNAGSTHALGTQPIIFLPLASSLYRAWSFIQAATPSVHSSPTVSHLPAFAAFLTLVELTPTPFSACTMLMLLPQAGSKPAFS